MRLELNNIHFHHENENNILLGVNFIIRQGELILISGPSGGGKTTMIEILAGLRQPKEGTITWGERTLYGEQLPVNRIDMERSRTMGLFFWDHRLSSHLTGWENILLPARLSGIQPDMNFIIEMADFFFRREKREEKEDVLRKPVKKMSAGQQERVAVLRAFVLKPPFVLADEMLRSVHPELREDLWTLIKRMCSELNIGLLLVTHHNELLNDPDIDRTMCLEGGVLQRKSHCENRPRPES